MGWPLIVVVCTPWIIGNTNLQSLWARLRGLAGVCQFAARETLVVRVGVWCSDRENPRRSDRCRERGDRPE
ncbi:hypothetical protein C4J97_4672 [Pseudomonas orientalis]|nr:hypothetical protein C4J97_4672 [Pseudomonas orientalis]